MSDAGSNVIVNGRWVTFIYDGSQINFKGGGGAASSDIAAATATSGLVLNGKTFYAGSSKGVKLVLCLTVLLLAVEMTLLV